ncbi:hypothetical protein HMPREF3039_03210 [Akkermansia sp. KLE1798]|nr:hypothetical protein HMPREF3039_03210 [Akkermansia sp. KLE1798]KZA04113.1 hypothetical protein HMPREF1326_02311 [Akkermansia sp. KLE1605]
MRLARGDGSGLATACGRKSRAPSSFYSAPCGQGRWSTCHVKHDGASPEAGRRRE